MKHFGHVFPDASSSSRNSFPCSSQSQRARRLDSAVAHRAAPRCSSIGSGRIDQAAPIARGHAPTSELSLEACVQRATIPRTTSSLPGVCMTVLPGGGSLVRLRWPPRRTSCSRQACRDGGRSGGGRRGSGARRLSDLISNAVNARVALACRVERLSIVDQKIRQLKMQNAANRLTNRSAVRSFDRSAWQPDFRIL